MCINKSDFVRDQEFINNKRDREFLKESCYSRNSTRRFSEMERGPRARKTLIVEFQCHSHLAFAIQLTSFSLTRPGKERKRKSITKEEQRDW